MECIWVIQLGEITTVVAATSKSASLRTTIPMSVVKQFDLNVGDKLDWSFEAKGGELTVVVRAVKS